jgi:hypothetical protein
MRISKSKFVSGVQCLKRLYLQVHQPEFAADLDDASKAVIEQGNQVGLVAQTAFSGGVTVQTGRMNLDEAIKATGELVANSEVSTILEATKDATAISKSGGKSICLRSTTARSNASIHSLHFSTTWGICFSLKAIPNAENRQGFGPVLAQLSCQTSGR